MLNVPRLLQTAEERPGGRPGPGDRSLHVLAQPGDFFADHVTPLDQFLLRRGCRSRVRGDAFSNRRPVWPSGASRHFAW